MAILIDTYFVLNLIMATAAVAISPETPKTELEKKQAEYELIESQWRADQIELILANFKNAEELKNLILSLTRCKSLEDLSYEQYEWAVKFCFSSQQCDVIVVDIDGNIVGVEKLH